MARPKVFLPEEELAPLQAQLCTWRSRRTGREPIPAEVWAGATSLARAHGICPVARALGLDYAALKARLSRTEGRSRMVKPAFLEIQAARPSTGTSIEITAPNGARMSIHLEAEQAREAAGIVAAFLGSRG